MVAQLQKLDGVSARESPLLAGWRHMRTCPRYVSCSAPICPLDPDWDLRTHDNDAVCAYLRESVRPDITARYAGRPDEHCLAAAIALRPAIEARHPSIAASIAYTADSPNLIDQAEAAATRARAMQAAGKGMWARKTPIGGREVAKAGTPTTPAPESA